MTPPASPASTPNSIPRATWAAVNVNTAIPALVVGVSVDSAEHRGVEATDQFVSSDSLTWYRLGLVTDEH